MQNSEADAGSMAGYDPTLGLGNKGYRNLTQSKIKSAKKINTPDFAAQMSNSQSTAANAVTKTPPKTNMIDFG